jgi:uncharacterized protein (TIGR03086 family)
MSFRVWQSCTCMTEISDRFRKVSADFLARAAAVPEGAWDNPAPPEGWVARDVVRHMVEWMPGLIFGSAGRPLPEVPPVDDDPVGAWRAVSDALQAALDDPQLAAIEFDSPGGRHSVETAIDQFCTNDIVVHTWDLARATGLDEALDPDEVHRMLEGVEPMDEALRTSGHYGPRVEVPADADEQTRLLAFLGRQP